MEFDAKGQTIQENYLRMVQLITPRPIAWVSTLSLDGVANLAPFSFFTGVGANPPTLCFAPANQPDGSAKDTLENIRRTGEFVVNLVTEDLGLAMHRSAEDVAPEIDEFKLVGVTEAESIRVQPPRVLESAAAMECTLHSVVTLGTGPGGANLVIGNVQYFHLRDGLENEKALPTVARVGRREYLQVQKTFRYE
ncbi:MAG: flavin reductase family protein [Planctomycetota bacterium]